MASKGSNKEDDVLRRLLKMKPEPFTPKVKKVAAKSKKPPKSKPSV